MRNDSTGEVQTVLFEIDIEIFARKLIRLFGGVTMEDIENEARQVSRLCRPGTSRYVVEMLTHGWLPSDDSVYFIDMKLCHETLEQYILNRSKQGSTLLSSVHLQTAQLTTLSAPIHEKVMPSLATLLIAHNIASGLAYLHELGAVHRDLKPRNGRPSFFALTSLRRSALLGYRRLLETRRLWNRDRCDF